MWLHPLTQVTVLLSVIVPLRSVQPQLPHRAAEALAAAYPGWELRAVPRTPDRTEGRNLLRGDYDGDGRSDWALLIASGNSGGASLSVQVVALFDRAHHFELTVVAGPWRGSQAGNIVLRAARKGTRGYDMNSDTWFTYERDAIIVAPDGAGPCTSFIYQGQRFTSLWTCD